MFLTVNHSEGNNNNNNNREFTPIAEGKYQAVITEVKISKSSAGNDMITVTLTIRDDVNQEFTRRKIWDYLVYSEKAKWKLQQVAKAVKIPDGTKIDTIQDFAKNIVLRPVTIDIKHEQNTYNGETKTKERVSAYTVADETTFSQPSDPFTTTAPTNNTNVSPF